MNDYPSGERNFELSDIKRNLINFIDHHSAQTSGLTSDTERSGVVVHGDNYTLQCSVISPDVDLFEDDGEIIEINDKINPTWTLSVFDKDGNGEAVGVEEETGKAMLLNFGLATSVTIDDDGIQGFLDHYSIDLTIDEQNE